jgi:hypothetical protein
LVTNTISRTRASIAAALSEAGLRSLSLTFSPAPVIAAAYLAAHYPGARCLLDRMSIQDQRPRTSGSQPGSVSSPISARWPTYSSSGSASWVLDVDVGAGVIQQIDPLQVDSQ